MGRSRNIIPSLGFHFLSCRRFLLLLLISVAVATCWICYVFLSEESQRADDKKYIRQQIRLKARLGENHPAPDSFKDLHQEYSQIYKKKLPDFEIISDSVMDDIPRRKKKPKASVLQYGSSRQEATDILSIPRLADYCNIPKLPQSGQEGEVAPGFDLMAVYTVIRHGDRTTLYSFPHHRNPSINCIFSSHQLNIHPKVENFVETMKEYKGKQKEGSRFVNWALYPDHKLCDNSFLTPSGALQHIINGINFNEKYIKKWQLLDDQFIPDQLKIQSTEYSRTYQSVIAFLYGFLPKFNLTELNIKQVTDLTFCSPKIVGSSCACPAIQHYKRQANHEVHSTHRNLTMLKKAQIEIMEVYELTKEQLPNNYVIFDILISYACHGIQLPCNSKGKCLTKESLAGIADYLDKNGADFEKSPSFQKQNQLSVYSLLTEIGQHMIAVAHQKTKEKFVIYSGHDKTVSPLLSVLGVNKGKWVKYGTRVVFELYRRKDNKDHYYIRVLHDGKDVTSDVIFCKGSTKNGLCKIKSFFEFIKEDSLSTLGTKNYAKACTSF